MKTRAMRLCCALHGRWTNREKAYILSLNKAQRLKKLFSEGWDASIFGELITPGDYWNETQHGEETETA